MHKWLLSTLITVACAMGVYLMATGLPEKPKDEAAGLKEGQKLLKIVATSFNFDQEEYHVKAGTNYKIKFSNKLGNHGAEIVGLNVNLTKDAPEMEVTFDKPGNYEVHCSIMCGQGHAGMKSKFIVE
ncbi:cytochrome C oxidase subunit II [Cohnella silvisoli]|uniref:Cytochrome c oxidase subunit II n=1 Tax=Cohnella silvisoli TaxID=2873699 RepID=A0ABV1KUC2_9BACL|nr:cytochrome C oxidase subunit II [Cohnella silvisoli]MCD9023190.1 cytochrome C oxidase subunit II [Cohnella silvisoli]